MVPVNLFVVGAAKSGTTSLASYLNQHPDIFVPEVKEPKYFSFNENVFPHNGPGDRDVDSKVIRDRESYEALYSNGSSAQFYCDASVDYLFHEGVSKRIYQYNSSARIIIMLRNPIERAYSAYMHLVRDGRETLPFEDAVKLEEKRIANNWEFFWHYRNCSMYSRQVKRYLDTFPNNQIKILLFENFVRDSQQVLSEISQFLGIDVWKFDTTKVLNPSGVPNSTYLHYLFNKRNIIKDISKSVMPQSLKAKVKALVAEKNLRKEPMTMSIRHELLLYFEDDIDLLSAMINQDLRKIWR